ncbi:auxin-responsive protein SAUR32-like [Diospyros lotus]|uniref:auxin-responsive protein SAUR32-like n=1 Tax=Diospyros lotus TaxID=55363 RepID=UPI0022548FEE|nr:auxin-responsive protein SAUR32-like [Diospyros lotus]
MGASGDKNNLMNFHFHFHLHRHHHRGEAEMKEIPKGCLAVTVGQGPEQQRFVIPVIYINHPLFLHLLKEAEEEYGFDQKGPINIPCHVEEFRHVQGLIDRENAHHRRHHHHHHHHHLCFGA